MQIMLEMCAEMHVGLHVKWLLSNFKKNWNVLTNFSKLHNIKMHENPFIGSPVVRCGQADTDRHCDANRHILATFIEICQKKNKSFVSLSSKLLS
jgi:hypothetical protein